MRLEHIKNLYNPNSLYVGKDWIWIRVHKTAGTSMYDYFLKDHCITHSRQKNKLQNWINSISENDLQKYFIWSFVRNPYDRFVSSASMFDIDPNTFARNFKAIRKSQNIVKRHSEPQHYFTHYKGQNMTNFIGTYENLGGDWMLLLKLLKLNPFNLPMSNASRHGKWYDILDDYSKQFVREFYKLDFQYFGYEF